MKQITAAIVALGMVGCAASDHPSLPSGDMPGEITCFSGQLQPIYHGKSEGKINFNQALGGYEFTEEGSGRLIRTNADCVIRY